MLVPASPPTLYSVTPPPSSSLPLQPSSSSCAHLPFRRPTSCRSEENHKCFYFKTWERTVITNWYKRAPSFFRDYKGKEAPTLRKEAPPLQFGGDSCNSQKGNGIELFQKKHEDLQAYQQDRLRSRSCWYAGGYQRLTWICPRTGIWYWPPCSCCW